MGVYLVFVGSPDPSWLCLVWTYSPVYPPVTKVWTNLPVGTTYIQIMPELHCIRTIVDTHRVCNHPDSTVSKLLTVLRWRTIPTLDRKQLEKQRVEPLCSLWGWHTSLHFNNVNATVSFKNNLTLLYSDLKIFHWTDKLTDAQNQSLNLFVPAAKGNNSRTEPPTVICNTMNSSGTQIMQLNSISRSSVWELWHLIWKRKV